MSPGPNPPSSSLVRGTTNTTQVFLLQSGARRAIPDPQTLRFLQAGRTVRVLSDADLAVIPLGRPLPTRADNTLYHGTGAIYAYLLSGGLKHAFPNATTLRDAGHDVAALLPLSKADAASIPDGAPFPSTSRFVTPPSSDLPLVLLPVRLETRFQGAELWLRVYPDTVHINSFEPELTSDEQTARTAYLTQAPAGPDAARTAFATLARQFGATRAAWIVSANVPAASKPGQWMQAPYTNVLPERWIVISYLGNAPGQVLAVGPPIQDSLQVGPAPNSTDPLADGGMKWVTDFNTAIQAGMAFRIALTPEQQRGFNRIVVLGLKTGLNSLDSAARLGDLLQAHHYTDGLELMALNTPTNNTETVNSGFSSKQTDYDAVFALEQGPSLCPTRPTADGDRLAAALNIAPAILSHVSGANGSQDAIAHAMNTALWPATWGYYLRQLVNGSVPNPDVIVPAARDHFAAAVRARGHFPVLRIGRQPYGLLPVCWSAQWKSLEGRPLDAPLVGLLSTLRTTWENSLANVPRIPGAADPEASLVNLLGMTASSNSFVARNMVGPEYNFSYWNFIQKDLAPTWWTAMARKTLVDTGALSPLMANTRLANSTYVKQPRPLTDVLVAPAPLDGVAAPSYIADLAGLGWHDLWSPGSGSMPIFYLLLRHAALRQYLDTAMDLLIAADAAQPDERIEPELIGFSTGIRPTGWDLLSRELPGSGPVGTFLDAAKQDATLLTFTAFWAALAQLAEFSAADLDAATREVFDLASYRLDAWITSLAYVRLESLRAANSNGGIVLGGYGWLENVHPQPQHSASAGFVHAPSLNQATTAAVLRAGYLAHNDASQRPFEIDLSSGKVRLALHLLDGIRQGQPLAALLGYRLERAMHDAKLDAFISHVRAMAPMTADGTVLDVVDGLVLLQRFHNDATFWNAPGLPAQGTAERTSLTGAITRLDDALDAAADLTLTESVHQLIRGNLLRAGATLDSIARGDTPPADIEVVDTPRSGNALGYRLMTIAPPAEAMAGWSSTPRALAEPCLNAWAGTMLGNPERVRIRVQLAGAPGTNATAKEIGLDQLDLAPLDVLSMPEAQGIPQELEGRIRRAVTTPATPQVTIVPDRDPAWSPQVIALSEWLMLARAVARLVNGARPLEPEDLVVQDGPAGTVNAQELKARADAAQTEMTAALTGLQHASAGDAALLAAAAFGVPGAIPDANVVQWPAQIAAAKADLAARAAKLHDLDTATSLQQQQQSDYHVSRLKAIFGASFQVLPVITPDGGDAWAASTSLQADDPLESVRWFQRVARARPGAARLDTAVMLAEAVSGQLLLRCEVAQLPAVAGDKWIALPSSTSVSRLSLVAFLPVSNASSAPIAGLMIDEWTEVLPNPRQTTGVSFQYTDPVARPPQSILLGVKPDDFPEWTMEAVEGSILEALALAKIRAVDPDSLGALGHYLPALFFAYNTGGTLLETVSTDLNTALKSMQGGTA